MGILKSSQIYTFEMCLKWHLLIFFCICLHFLALNFFLNVWILVLVTDDGFRRLDHRPSGQAFESWLENQGLEFESSDRRRRNGLEVQISMAKKFL